LIGDRKCNPENAAKYDVENRTSFHCLTGHIKAELFLMIEPDPHGTESGKDGHFHIALICANARVPETPTEPDRCQITDDTCPFVGPVGPTDRDPKKRKFALANKIVQGVAFIDFFGSQILSSTLESKGPNKKLANSKVFELNKSLLSSGIINTETFQVIDNLRKTRNVLAHDPEGYLKFTENQLYEFSRIAAQTASYLENRAQKGS
jgi:hypothetical protein